MEKILMAIDSQNINPGFIKFGCYLAKLSHSMLTAVFINKVVVEEEVSMLQTELLEVGIQAIGISESISGFEKEDEYANRIFMDILQAEGVDGFFDESEMPFINDLFSRTRFADLLVLDAKSLYDENDDEVPSKFVKYILGTAQCPVVIAPRDFEEVDSIIFCYNGIKSSVYAMKQFTYLFPEFKNRKAILIHHGTDGTNQNVEKEMLEWLACHYNDVEIFEMDKHTSDAFFSCLVKKKNDFIVMGQYGQNFLSSFFQLDDIADKRNAVALPFFITHY